MSTDMKIPLTPGQVVCLGGLLVEKIIKDSEGNIEFQVLSGYYESLEDFCKGRMILLMNSPKVKSLFDIISDKASEAIIRPKKGAEKEFTVVKIIKPSGKFLKSFSWVKYGIIFNDVDKKLLTEVHKEGDKCDVKMYMCKIGQEANIESIIAESLKSEIKETASEISSVLVDELKEDIKTMFSDIMKKYLDSLTQTILTELPTQSLTKKKAIPYAKIQAILMGKDYVFSVEWHDDVLTVGAFKNHEADVIKDIEALGGKLIDKYYGSRFVFMDFKFDEGVKV